MKTKLLTVAQAAELKQVSRAAIYAAIRDGRLPHRWVLGKVGVREADVLAWTPSPSSGRRKGTRLGEESRRRISEAQKRRWAKQKGEELGESGSNAADD